MVGPSSQSKKWGVRTPSSP